MIYSIEQFLEWKNNHTSKSTTQQFNNTISTNSNKGNDLQARSLIEFRLCYYKNLPRYYTTRAHHLNRKMVKKIAPVR
ncbi:unnamed protein product [Acanthoscelides obtectus]|uniref:Uncharacterized protein n=1 Tax=Acanthoscelides obtectus TaxID=200917 RepID=A0A9P0JT47_ACAOB|nr:unnamed protein product [Acanthoscelides obtectus]CAK1662029.1 hypothetical protein AOBTE_LOCUS22939 [Acanthoscelides obtectus]